MTKIAGRYEITAKLGEGGMGVVYRAYDPHPMDREVAVKTLHHFADPMALDLFYKECRALKSISHPNIVEIFDMGEYEEDGHSRPFFVMPLLPGQTLDELIRKSSHRLTVDRVIEIAAQTCRGLQAAHDRGLIHRDLKPSNIFVMTDDSVKIIDFGVAHAVHAHSRTAGFDKGTLLYMAPEQLQHKPISIQSDIYSLAVTIYEALTRRQPFRAPTEEAVIHAILSLIPPPASELNPSVNQLISRVVHKAMAKQPWNRYDAVREFGDTLQKASRNEPIALFDPARIQPRIQTAARALEKGDFQFAGEIVGELEAEGNIDPEITLLRTQIDQIARQKMIGQLLDSARARFEEQEDPLALQKLHEVLQLDPGNVAALGLKGKIEDRRSERQIENWITLARQHVSNHSYGHAREALQNALVLRPRDTRAARLLKEIEGEEREYVRLRQEKTEMYHSAVNAWKNGEVSHALSQMKRVLEIDRVAPDSTSPDAAGMYQSFYNKIRSDHDLLNTGYQQARRHLAEKQFGAAQQVCREFLEKYPNQALFQALKFDIDEQQRQQLSAFIADVDRRLDAEQDLDAKVNLLREAANEYPAEDHFARLLKLAEDKRDLVNSIVERARIHEQRGQISEALSDLDTLQTIYGVYPGLKFEKDRLRKRLEQHTRDAARARWVSQVDQQIDNGHWQSAIDLVEKALVEFPGDLELLELRQQAQQGIERAARAEQLANEGQQLCADGEFDQGVDLLKNALQLDDRSTVRLTLRDVFVMRAEAALDKDWRTVEAYADRALELDPTHALARSLRAQALDHKRRDVVDRCAAQARKLQGAGDLDAALAAVNEGLTLYPAEPRLTGISEALNKDLSRTRGRSIDLEQLSAIGREAEVASGPREIQALIDRTRLVLSRHANEPEFQNIGRQLEERLAARSSEAAAQVEPANDTEPLPVAATIVLPAGRKTIAPLSPPPAEPATPAAVTEAPAPVAAPAPPVVTARKPPTPARSGSTTLWIGVAAAVVLLAAVGAFLLGPGSSSSGDQPGIGADGAVAAPPATPPDPGVDGGAAVVPSAGTAVPGTAPVLPAAAGTAVTTLTLQQLPPGTQVLLDGTPLGAAAADGSFVSTQVPVGRRTIDLTNPDYEPVRLTRTFAATAPVTITGAELGLKRMAMSIEVLADADTTLRLSQGGTVVQQATGPTTLTLADGTYEVRAEGPSGIPLTRNLSVAPGGARVLDLRGVPSGLERFPAGSWTLRDSWNTRKGGGYVLYNRAPPQYSATFTARRNRGRLFGSGQRLRWVVAYQDERNHVRLELDDDRFYRVEITNGQEKVTQIKHGIANAEQVHLSVQVAGGRLVHQYSLPGKPGWQTIETWTRPTPLDGRFGFYLPGDEEIQLTNFAFSPSAN
jgi:serine/threonine-protein kinase